MSNSIKRNISNLYSLVIFIVVLVALYGLTSANKQLDRIWQPLGSGMDSGISSFVIFEDDLIASGFFTTADGQPANRVARWNGSGWQAIGSGMDAGVFEIAKHNGELFAGGTFLEADGKEVYGLARWDGTEWQPVATERMDQVTNALFSFEGNLIAGGRFTKAGDKTVNHVARWDGNEWHPMGLGLGRDGRHAPTVQVFIIFEGDLIAGGSFDLAGGEEAHFIARWDGVEWHSVGSGLHKIEYGGISDLAIYEGDLVAAGRFSMADGDTVPAARLINGEWQPIETGISGSALEVYEGELYMSRSFITEESELGSQIVRWDGSSWHIVGVSNATSSALTTYSGSLVAGGMFTTMDGRALNHVAMWSN